MANVFYFLSCLSLLAAWMMPVHFFPWPAFYSDFAAFLMLLFLVLALGRLAVSGVALALAGIAFVPLLQWLAGEVVFVGDAIIACVYILGFALALAVGQSIKQADVFLKVACAVLLIAAVLSVWVALLQWLGSDGGPYMMNLRDGARVYANLAQPNNLATLLCMGLCAVLYVYERRLLGSVVASALALILMIGIALTQSRTPWLIFAALAVFWYWKTRHMSVRISFLTLPCWALVYVLIAVGLPYVNNMLLLEPFDFARETGALRLQLWWQLAHALLDGPWWGYGWNQVSLAQVAVAADLPLPLQVEYSHNVVLDILLWNGPLLGGVFVLGAIFWLGRLACKANTLGEICILLALGALLTHGFLELPLAYAYFLLPAGILLGFLSTQINGQPKRAVGVQVVWGLALVGALLMALIWREYRLIEEDHRLMRFEAAGIGAARVQQAAPEVQLLTQLSAFIRYARTPADAGMTDEQIAWMGLVAHRYAYAPSLFRYALALALNERLEEADLQLQVLKGLHGEQMYQEGVQGLRTMSERYPQLLKLQALTAQ